MDLTSRDRLMQSGQREFTPVWARTRIYFSDRLGEIGQHTTDMRDKMQTETREESTNNKDMLLLILSAVLHTKEEITVNIERVSNLTQRAQQKNENREECRRAKTERE